MAPPMTLAPRPADICRPSEASANGPTRRQASYSKRHAVVVRSCCPKRSNVCTRHGGWPMRPAWRGPSDPAPVALRSPRRSPSFSYSSTASSSALSRSTAFPSSCRRGPPFLLDVGARCRRRRRRGPLLAEDHGELPSVSSTTQAALVERRLAFRAHGLHDLRFDPAVRARRATPGRAQGAAAPNASDGRHAAIGSGPGEDQLKGTRTISVSTAGTMATSARGPRWRGSSRAPRSP
jgi:hypothetical protein